jgi:hypothetical protein
LPIESPVTELANWPVPVPSVVILFSIVGFELVPQHTPRETTEVPPSLVTVPPDVADVYRISLTGVVVTEGEKKVTSLFLQERCNMIIRITPEILNMLFIEIILFSFFPWYPG